MVVKKLKSPSPVAKLIESNGFVFNLINKFLVPVGNSGAKINAKGEFAFLHRIF